MVRSGRGIATINRGLLVPIVPRYAEIDQQGVVFNGHYLTWFDEAFTGFMGHLGVGYSEMVDAGGSHLDFASVRVCPATRRNLWHWAHVRRHPEWP